MPVTQVTTTVSLPDSGALRPAVAGEVPDRKASAGSGVPSAASPVIGTGVWFDDEGRPLRLRMEFPLSAEQMVAALYVDGRLGLCREDLAADEAVWGFTAIVVARDGLDAVDRAADEILIAGHRRMVEDPGWLAFVRRRVADVTGARLAGECA